MIKALINYFFPCGNYFWYCRQGFFHMEENIYLHTVNGFRYFLFYHFCFNVKQDVFFLLIVTFFL